MSRKTNGVKWNKSSSTKQRRSNVIQRLQLQLVDKKKNTKNGLVDLLESDIERIKKEIFTLKERV